MNTAFGVYPEAWLRMQSQEIERGLARRARLGSERDPWRGGGEQQLPQGSLGRRDDSQPVDRRQQLLRRRRPRPAETRLV